MPGCFSEGHPAWLPGRAERTGLGGEDGTNRLGGAGGEVAEGGIERCSGLGHHEGARTKARSQYRLVAALNAQLKARPCGWVFAMRSHDQIGFGPPDLAECVDQNAAHAPCWTTELEPEAHENATSTGQDGASMPPSPTRGPTCPSGELRA